LEKRRHEFDDDAAEIFRRERENILRLTGKEVSSRAWLFAPLLVWPMQHTARAPAQLRSVPDF
jgi:hypothetical protein